MSRLKRTYCGRRYRPRRGELTELRLAIRAGAAAVADRLEKKRAKP